MSVNGKSPLKPFMYEFQDKEARYSQFIIILLIYYDLDYQSSLEKNKTRSTSRNFY